VPHFSIRYGLIIDTPARPQGSQATSRVNLCYQHPLPALLTLFLIATIYGCGTALAASAPVASMPAAPTQAVPSDAGSAQAAPEAFVSHHKGVFGGVALNYTATVAGTFLTDTAGAVVADMVTVAYTRDSADASHRPVTFLYNGGPGSSSAWLHMGAFGPRRIELPSDAQNVGVAPYPLADNPASLLDVTDLVFIDPIGTGFSHALGSAKNADYWNLIADADSVTELIRTWLAKNRRENSPKYMVGESYGSERAAVVVHELQNGAPGKITFNGLILLGQDLDTTETQQTAGNDMPYVIYLPTYAATAWYHHKIDRTGRTFEGLLAEAREFARTDYAAALFAGSTIAPEELHRVAARMSQLTSLPQGLIEREGLRIGTAQFLRELLKDQGRILIRSDTRYSIATTETVFAKDQISDPPGVYEAFTAVGADYLRRELGVAGDRPYVLTADANWDYTLPDGINNQQTYHNVAPYVATAMRANPAMRMFVASGYYDMLAAFHSMERTVSHSGLPSDRITMKYYPSGHMIFLNKPSLEQLSADLRIFFRDVSR